MEPSPAPGSGFQGLGNIILLSEPAERGTPRADLVDALFYEDIARCSELLDRYPELVRTPLRHQAYKLIHPRDSAWGLTADPLCHPVTAVVFASLVPRLREPDLDSRALSPTGLAIIALLVERGAVLEISPRHHYWASHLLIEVCRDYDSPEALDLLARIGADIYTRRLDEDQHTLLQVAAGRGAVGAVGFLLDRGVPMNYTSAQYDDGDHDGPINGTPLHWAAAKGRSRAVRLLLSRGALSDIGMRDQDGCTPLLCAARGHGSLFWDGYYIPPLPNLDREETIRLLIDAGADAMVSDRGFCPNSALGYVTSWGSVDIIRCLVSKGADIHQQPPYLIDENRFPYSVGGDKVTPLHTAAYNSNAAAVQTLLDLGADPDATDEYGRQPLHWAVIGRFLGHSPEIISWTWNSLQTDPQKSSALSKKLAALELTISHLIAHNASVNCPDTFGRTPLHYAAYMKQTIAMTLFLQHGADPCLIDTDGRTTFHHLASPLYTPHFRDLADATTDDAHLTTTTLATRIQDSANTTTILNHRDNTGTTALHLAARCASAPVVALLLTLGADPNLALTFPDNKEPETQEAGKTTALHLAAHLPSWARRQLGTYEEQEYVVWKRRAVRIKELLLGAGADDTVRDGRGRTAGEVEEAVWAEIRRGREKYLAYLAQPPREYGRGRGMGWGRGQLGRGGPRGSRAGDGDGDGSSSDSGSRPGPTTEGGRVDVVVGAGHGRGSGE